MMSCARAKKIGNLAILCFLLLSFRAASHPLVCTFVDQEGDPLESVETRLVFLEAESKEEVETHYQKSNAKGRADFKNLRPGSYVVQAQLEGYMPCKVVINIQAAERLQRVLLKQKEFEDQEQKALESLNSQDFKTAIQELERLSEHYPEDASLHDNLARAYAGILDEHRALAEADRAAELDPGFGATKNEVQQLMLRTSGEKALQERDFKTAVERFTALRKLDPQDPAAHEGLALAYGHQGKLEEALQAIRRALEIDPGNPSFQKIREILEVNAGIREP